MLAAQLIHYSWDIKEGVVFQQLPGGQRKERKRLEALRTAGPLRNTPRNTDPFTPPLPTPWLRLPGDIFLSSYSRDQVTRNHTSDLQLLPAPEVTSPARAVISGGLQASTSRATGLFCSLCSRVRLHTRKKQAFSKRSNATEGQEGHPASSSSPSSSPQVKTTWTPLLQQARGAGSAGGDNCCKSTELKNLLKDGTSLRRADVRVHKTALQPGLKSYCSTLTCGKTGSHRSREDMLSCFS